MTISHEKLRKIWDSRVFPSLFGSAQPSDHPVFLNVGGQPGAGKTQGAEDAARLLHPDETFVTIDLDALREYHPDYKSLVGNQDLSAMMGMTHQFARQLTDWALAYARDNKISFIYEETLWSP